MVFGTLNGIDIMCMQGRFHYYEGYPLTKCSMPVRVMKLCGIKTMICTNAAGGLNESYKVGDLMIMHDHINVMGFAGNSPLLGPNDPRFGPRFPPMSRAYDPDLVAAAKQVSFWEILEGVVEFKGVGSNPLIISEAIVTYIFFSQIAEDMGIAKDTHAGVYTCLGGPNYETVAELRMWRMLGVDAVGMSTVHEVITAKHCDLKVFAFSLITNKCDITYSDSDEANHAEVMQVGELKADVLKEFVSRMTHYIASKTN